MYPETHGHSSLKPQAAVSTGGKNFLMEKQLVDKDD
jgi:hypothetical protein